VVTGAKSPLYYQWLTDTDSSGFYAIGNLLGIPELMGPSYFTNGGGDVNRPARHQVHKYNRCEVYHNTEFEKILVEKTFVPGLRAPEISPWISLEQAQEVHARPFNYVDFARYFARLKLTAPEVGLFKVLDLVQEFIDTGVEHSDPEALGDLAALSDRELKRAINDQWYVCAKYTPYGLINFVVYYRQMMPLFARMISDWYDGDNKNAFAELCQGVSTRSKTLEENLRLYDLAERIRASSELSALFAAHRGANFFTALHGSEEGSAFLQDYRDFAREHGHRGHEDRDFSYTRRYEDPAIDYRNFQLLLARDHCESPYEREEMVTQRRQEAFDDVVRNVRQTPFTGKLKAEAIKLVYTWVQKFIRIRDDERWAYEKSSLCAKLLCREAGRRCAERGVLLNQEDFLMFTKDELFDLLDGRMGVKLARAKAAQRRIDHDRALDVLSRNVGNAADRRATAERGVGSVMVVDVQPAWQGCDSGVF
jgi:pyruvate,water dikinase